MVDKEVVGSSREAGMGRLWIFVLAVAVVTLAGIVARNMTAKREM